MRITNLLLTCLFLSHFSHIFGQHVIQEKINQNASQIQEAERFTPFLEISPNAADVPITDDLLSEKQIFDLKKQTIQDIRNNKGEYLRLNIPIEGQNRELHLLKAEIFSPDFRLELASAPGVTVDHDRGLHYRGTLADTPESLVAISFFEDEISGFIAINDQHFTIGKIENSDKHVLYEKNNFNEIMSFECEAISEENLTSNELEPPEKSTLMNCVSIHIEADYSLYQTKNSDINATYNYVLAIFAQTAILYANESINTNISFLRIWNTASPYGTADPLTDLNNQGYGKTHGDLVHLLHTFYPGGVAYVNVICRNDINTGVSGISGSYANVPTFSWDVEVLTHELGHNLGSPHTHSCSWNGNDTQIDDCGNKYLAEDNDSNTNPGACYNANNQILPAGVGGTIMSYCHLVSGVGINFNNGFGQQPGDLIRSRINSAACLMNCQCSDGVQNGNETGVDCGGDCAICPTCDDGILNGDEMAIDCGGTDCPACPPEDCSTFNFNSGVLSYDPNQDFGTHSVQDGGATLYLQGNAWKAIEINYTITQNTVLEFDFKSTLEGEIHELGFDNDLAFPMVSRIVTYGTQGYNGEYNNPTYDGSGDYIHYTIDLGVTGFFKYLVMTADDDANAVANSYFKNIQIYEDYNGNFQCGSESPPTLDICVQLEGAYDILSGSMNNNLEDMDVIPQSQSYNQPPWNYNGTEQNDISDVVDWLLVSFRTGVESNTQVARTAGLLKTDGCIYFPDEDVLPAGLDAPVYIVVEHRNHIGVMSAEPVNIVNNMLTFDFRTTQTYKNAGSYGQKQLINGTWCMYTGNMQPNELGYDINGGDKSIWVNDNGTFNQYLPSDLNHDGDVNGADKGLWFDNNGVYSIVSKSE